MSNPTIVGAAKGVETEGLGRLDPRQSSAIHGLGKLLGDAGERIADGQYGRCAFEEFERREEPVDDLGRAEGPRGIVDEHGIAIDRGEAGPHGIRALGAAFDELADVETAQCSPSALLLALPNDNPNGSDGRMPYQRLDRPPQRWLARDRQELLGHVSAQALAFAGGNDEGGRGHSGGRLGALALSAKARSII
jgi:hypothetical protein